MSKDEPLIGGIGRLIVASRGAAGPGEVEVRVRGGRETFIAYSDQPLPQGTSVLIIESHGSRAVQVSPWDDPLPELDDEVRDRWPDSGT